MSRRRAGVGLVAILAGAMVAGLVIGGILHVFASGSRSAGRTSPLAVQKANRRAVVRLLTVLEEAMEVVSPPPGSVLPGAVVRDKLSRAQWFHLVQKGPAPATPAPALATSSVMELWRHVDDPSLPEDQRSERLLDNVRQLTFTARSAGALEVHLVLAEGEAEYPFISTVRLRNVASAEEVF